MQSLEGCIREITINENALDLTRPQVSSLVTPCYMSTEPGAYFHGAGYALLGKEKWNRDQFHRAAKHKNLLSMKFLALITTGLPTQFPRDFQDKQTKSEYQ